jgi:dihydrofolate synthase/folylpolyglutamate synthase
VKTYGEILDWMFNQLPMYQKQGATAFRKNLDNTLLLSDYLNHPENKIRTIHIAGTNGKGSTSSMFASILQEAGYKVGLYTSPHLKDFRERIKINGQEIPEKFVCDFILRHQSFFEDHNLSFFEMTVGLAFDYFEKQKVDIAIVETGMGGRLDSTNIITPLVSVITNIGLDHTQFLGNTISEIASEKAGIIKFNIPVVIGEYNTITRELFERKAAENQSEIYFASDIITETPMSDLTGIYQEKNKKTVLQTIKVLQQQNLFKISDKHITKGLLHVVQNTGLLGRWQILQENPKVICDTAHNKHGLEIVLEQLQKEPFEKLHIVLGVVSDKDLDLILPLFPKNATYYFCKPNVLRGMNAEFLQQEALTYNLMGQTYNSVYNAFEKAKTNASKQDLIYVGGSTFVVAEVI